MSIVHLSLGFPYLLRQALSPGGTAAPPAVQSAPGASVAVSISQILMMCVLNPKTQKEQGKFRTKVSGAAETVIGFSLRFEYVCVCVCLCFYGLFLFFL